MRGCRATGEVHIGDKWSHCPSTGIDSVRLKGGGARCISKNVVDQYIPWTRGRTIRSARKAAADGKVEQNIERMVVYPLLTCRDIGRGNGEEWLRPIVPVKLHPVLRPDDAIGVIGAIVNPAAVGEGKASADPVRSGISGTANRTRCGRGRILPPPLHDVLLTAGRPADADGANVAAQHPECRPAASRWNQLHPSFHSSILKFVFPCSVHPARRTWSA